MTRYHGQTLKSLVEFLYHGDLNEATVKGHAVELLRLTDDYGLTVLQPRICDHLKRNFLIADTKPADDEYVRLWDNAVVLIKQNAAVAFTPSENDEDVTKEKADAIKKLQKSLNSWFGRFLRPCQRLHRVHLHSHEYP